MLIVIIVIIIIMINILPYMTALWQLLDHSFRLVKFC